MDITPPPELLYSVRAERIKPALLVGEATDNSLDAGASHIEIFIDQNKISFKDDGRGIERDKIRAMFAIGKHGHMSTTALGRFGVGIKTQAIIAGDILHVLSTSKDGKFNIEVNWKKVLESQSWSIDDPRWMPVSVDAKTGTLITISRLKKMPPLSEDAILDDIAQRFYPALSEGKRIAFNGRFAEALAEPPMTEIIDRHLELSGGRTAHIRAGLLVNPSRLNRVHVSYKHRVIMPSSTFGCGESVGLGKMFARLQIFGQWHLAKFKDNLTDEMERDELYDVVADCLKPILEKCSSASMTARVAEITQLLNDRLPSTLAPARPKLEKPQNRSGQKRGKQGAVAAEKSESGGPSKARRPSNNGLIITMEGIAEEHGVGFFERGRVCRVNLSKDDPLIARLLPHRDQEVIVGSLMAIAIAIYEQGKDEESPDPELPLIPFGMRIAKILAMQDSKTLQSARSIPA